MSSRLHPFVVINKPNMSAPLPHSAAIFLADTDKGFLPNRLTTAERDVLNDPATGLLIFNTSLGAYQFFNGSIWIDLGSTDLTAAFNAFGFTLTGDGGINSANYIQVPASFVGIYPLTGTGEGILEVDSYGNAPPVFTCGFWRGTVETPEAVLQGDALYELDVFGGTGSGIFARQTVQIQVIADETFSTATGSGARASLYIKTFDPSVPQGVKPTTIISNDGGWMLGDINSGPVTGGSQGVGTINVTGGYYIDGINQSPDLDPTYTIATPLSGATVPMNTGQRRIIIKPSGTLASLTVQLPPTPVDGQLAGVAFTEAITSLTLSGQSGASVIAGPVSASAGSRFGFLFQLADTSWYPAS